MRGFTEQEREQILAILLEKGKEYFSLHGLKKTSIRDLTEAAGIAQGSFYLFFQSKEELYFRLLEKEEEAIQTELLTGISIPMDEVGFAEFLIKGISLIQENAFIRKLYFEGEMELLMRKLPSEIVEEHIKKDEDVLLPLLSAWGIPTGNEDLKTISGAVRAFFLVSLHRKEIGDDCYDGTIRFMAKAISKQLFTEVES